MSLVSGEVGDYAGLGGLIFAAIPIVPVAVALFQKFPLFSWIYELSYWGYRHPWWSVLPRNWTYDEYQSGLRVFIGFVGAFGFVLGAGTWLMAVTGR